MTHLGIELTIFWLVAKTNNTAIIFPSPINSSHINHTFDNKQSELLECRYIKHK